MSSPLSVLTRRIDAFRRTVLLHRRGLAALAAAIAVYAGLQAAAEPPAPTVSVWTAARDLPGGSVLTADALTRTAYLPRSVPDGAIDSPREVVGRTLAAPLRRGQVLTGQAVVSDHWLDGRTGVVAVPVRLTDPQVATLLHPGDHVDVLAADPQDGAAARLLVRGATVLAVPDRPEERDSDELRGRLVVLGVPPTLSETLAGASASRFLTVAWPG